MVDADSELRATIAGFASVARGAGNVGIASVAGVASVASDYGVGYFRFAQLGKSKWVW